MKLTFVVFLLIMLLVGGGTAKADSVPIDPDMIPTDAGGCGVTSFGPGQPDPAFSPQIVQSIFNFSANAVGGGGASCPEAFRNGSGSSWTGLTVTLQGFNPSPCNVSGSDLFLFHSCTFDADTNTATMAFWGVGWGTLNDQRFFFKGILDGGDFFMNLGEKGWPPGDNSRTMGPFTAVATVPEPASVVLISVGLAAFGLVRRKLTNARNVA
ncbi:MAG TPA: PEP-CTERM sorting domain-containing protein [Candidatus Dormibacteraeota bacterium]|nr:PEP-CTERM sorting domain-containing protein [Candidatus Dormibacteraeota bacterium]